MGQPVDGISNPRSLRVRDDKPEEFAGLHLVGILLLAFGLRVIMLDARPLWYDDTFSLFLSQRDLATIAQGTAADTMPPLYYTLLHYWIALTGQTPFALRMLSVAISMLIVALMFVCVTRAFGAQAGAWTAFLTALAPFQIYYAQELRMYGTLAVGLTLYLYGLIRLLDTARARGHKLWAFILVVVGMTLALYSHNLAFVTLAAGNVYLLGRRAWRLHVQLLCAQVIGLGLFLPWLVYVPGQLAKIQHAFWTQPPGPVDLVQLMMVFTTYLPLPPAFLLGALFVTITVVVLAAFKLLRLRKPAQGSLIVTFALIPPALLFCVSHLVQPVFVPRGVIASGLAYYALLGLLAARMPRRGQFVAAGLALGIALAFLPFLYTGWGEWRRAPFDEADRFLRAKVDPGDLVLHDTKMSFFPMHWYDRALPQSFLADPPGSSNDTLARASQQALELYPVAWEGLTSGRSRVWFVIFQTALDEASQEGHPHGNLSRLDAAMRRVNVTSFGDLDIFLYEAR